jgi:choline kinase
MQALILAAGGGSRLGIQGDGGPKCLLEIGGRPLIEHQLEALADAGIGPVGMVVGYRADEIREAVRIRAEYIENRRWDATNSLYSFWLAREWVRGPVLVLNSDIIFDPRVLERVMAVEGDAFAYDSTSGQGAEHMKVRLSDKGRLLAMSKEFAPEHASGENVGLLKFTGETAARLLEHAGRLVEAGQGGCWLGSAICELARERRIQGVDIAGLPWGEIDFAYDLDKVRREVYPAIAKARRQRRPWVPAKWASAAAVLLLSGVLLGNLTVTPVESVWSTLDPQGVDVALSHANGQTRSWSVVEHDGRASVEVTGPTRLRIDSRLVLPADARDDEEFAYILDVHLDGERVDRFEEKATASKSWTLPDQRISKRSRVSLAIPAGRHTLGIGLLSSQAESGLLRIRQQEPDDVED